MSSVYLVRFFSYLALSSLLPFYSVWLFGTKLFSVAEIALLVSLLILSNRLISFFISPMMSKYHKKHIVLLMQVLGILCSISLYFSALWQFNLLIYWCLMTLLFGSVFSIITLSLLTIVSNQVKKQDHITGFSYINIALNLSAGIGPFLGGLIIHYFSHYFTLVPALILMIALAFSFRLPLDESKAFSRAKFRHLFSVGNRKMLVLLVVNFLIFIAYAQFYESFPLLAKNFISTNWIGILFLINGITIALLQVPISNVMRKKPFSYLILSHTLFFIGLLLLPLITLNLYAPIVLGIIFISIAEIIFAPIYRSLCVKWNTKTNSEIALAKLNLMWGSGNSLAAYIGLYWIGHQYFTYPYFLGAGALIVAMIILFFNRAIFSDLE